MATQSQTFRDVSASVSGRQASLKVQRRQGDIALYITMILLGIVFMFPFFWTVSSSLKQPWELYNFPPTWLPETPQWANYARVLTKVPFLMWAWNSVFVVVLTVVGTVLSASIVAYSFARFSYRGR